MRNATIVSLSLCTFGLGGLAGAFALAGARGTSAAAPAGDAERALARTLETLAADVDAMKQRVQQLERRPEGAARLPDRADRRDLGAGDTIAPAHPAAAPGSKDPEAEERAVLAAAKARLAPKFEALLRAGLPRKELAQLLADAAAAGEDEAAIAALQEIVAKNPDDPHARYALARAAFARTMRESTPAGYEKWGGLALDAWQKAADLDPNYWEPRFERAEYLTYYPESEGKTPEAIASLEGALELQGASNSDPRYARTYAHLSRMYLRAGNRAKALQTLRDGVALFPEDQELAGQLKVLKQE